MARQSLLLITIAAASLLLATALGAFAAHGLDGLLEPDSLAAFRTAVDYQFFHGLGLIGAGLLNERYAEVRAFAVAGWLLIIGTLLFCGSIYVTSFGFMTFLGAAAPIGGLSFMLAWLCLGFGAWRSRRHFLD
jgi:uncharacterized membrane protein YgdD (TMEM256/DUF423 family)